MSYALAIHGGAGELRSGDASSDHEAALRAGLLAALQSGQDCLEHGGSALDAVQQSVTVLEDDPLFNAGRGAVLTRRGTVELDASIMDGATLAAGAVAQITRLKNPIQLARRVMEDSPHVFLAGPGAEQFAQQLGMPLVSADYFITAERRAQLARLGPQAGPGLGTVGAVARDARSNLAAATSTGGTAGKLPGRIGDSPLIGAGTYADNASCAVSATGHGEWLIRTVQAYDIAARLRYAKSDLQQAVSDAVEHRLVQLRAAAGVIAIDRQGAICMRHNTSSMFCASVRAGESPFIALY